MSDFGERIKVLMLKKGIESESSLARRIGKDQQRNLNRWLDEDRAEDPKLEPSVFVKLADIFEITIDELLGHIAPMGSEQPKTAREYLDIIESAVEGMRRIRFLEATEERGEDRTKEDAND